MRRAMRDMSPKNGFTLIELVVTVAIFAILVAVAVPSFMDLIKENRLSSEANQLLSAASLARSEAVKLGRDVTLHPKNNNYDEGWCVFPTGDAADCTESAVIRNFAAPEAIDVSDHSLGDITFDNQGYRSVPALSDGNVCIEMKPPGGQTGVKLWVLSVSPAGRASLPSAESSADRALMLADNCH